MTEQAKSARNAYYKSWREKNQDKIKGYMETYWAKKAEQLQQLEEAQRIRA